MTSLLPRLAAIFGLLALFSPDAMAQAPTEPAVQGCQWDNVSDPLSGLTAWVQNCDSDGRQSTFVFKDRGLYQQLSDSKYLNQVVRIYDIEPGESAVDAVDRVYAEHTFDDVAARCVRAAVTDAPAPEGVARYQFIPGPALQKEMDATAADGMPENACGDLGLRYDSGAYFQTIEGADKILFLELGNDTPMFDTGTLSFAVAADATETTEEEVLPYVGKWDCGKMTISIDPAVYNDGKKNIEIQEAQEGTDGSYTLLFADDSFVTLSNFKPDDMSWLSSTAKKPLQCKRMIPD